MTKPFSTFVIWIVAIVATVFFVRYLASIHAFPSFSEYVASTTDTVASSSNQLIEIVTPRGTIHAFSAITPDQLARGLSGRESLENDQGMLFVFPTPDIYGFWMKDMNFPLDIVWIDEGKRVVGVAVNVATSTFPKNFLPPSPITSVLELNAGEASRLGIATGTVLVF